MALAPVRSTDWKVARSSPTQHYFSFLILPGHALIIFLNSNPVCTKDASTNSPSRYLKIYRADWIRTNDLLNPIQALYQTELQPATFASETNLHSLRFFCKGKL